MHLMDTYLQCGEGLSEYSNHKRRIHKSKNWCYSCITFLNLYLFKKNYQITMCSVAKGENGIHSSTQKNRNSCPTQQGAAVGLVLGHRPPQSGSPWWLLAVLAATFSCSWSLLDWILSQESDFCHCEIFVVSKIIWQLTQVDPPMWETDTEFWVPCFSLAQPSYWRHWGSEPMAVCLSFK